MTPGERLEHLSHVAEARARQALRAIRTAAVHVWRKDPLFLLLLCFVHVLLARRTFRDGIWADNDSVCHYAYLRHLLEDVYPHTGSFLGYSPRFNVGVPFLLYNTPPGVYVLSGVTSVVLHVSALAALKLCAVLAYLAVPLSGFWLARTFEDERTDLPKFVAISLGLFTSELFGLEFYFKNGMLNPAFGVPMMIATLAAYREAVRAPMPRALAWLALGGFLFALTVCTHLLTAYMLAVALLGFVVGPAWKGLGHNAIKAGVVAGLGGLLAGFWLYPSLTFAAKEDAAFTWLRRPADTVGSFLDGSLLSSYFAGFFPSFIAVNNVGILAIVLGAAGVFEAFRLKNHGVRSVVVTFVLAFWIALGPWWSSGIRILPAYDRLLWYRFVTLAICAWLVLAGYGAYRFSSSKVRFYPFNVGLLGLALVAALIVLGQRAAKVSMASEFPQFLNSVDQVAAWMREKGDRRGRVFSEFLGQAVVHPPSVNYTRHMIPVLTGFDEVSGWIYENNVASQVMQRKGLFWYDPFPMVEEAPLYNVKYIVAGSPQFIRAATLDPRWKAVVTTPDLVLFEATSYEPTLAEAPGLAAQVIGERYRRGGGYEYDLDVTTLDPLDAGSRDLLVKVGYLPGWRADLDGRRLDVRAGADGLVRIALPRGAVTAGRSSRLRMVWEIDDLRRTGDRLSLAGLVLALVLVGASRVGALRSASVGRVLNALGVTGFAAVMAAFAVRSRSVDLSAVGFGVRGGIVESSDPSRLSVGAYTDDPRTMPTHVLAGAWGPRRVVDGRPARALEHPSRPAAEIGLPPGASRLKVTLAGEASRAIETVRVSLSEPGAGDVVRAPSCVLEGRPGAWLDVPASCTTPGAEGDVPGVPRHVRLDLPAGTLVSAIDVDRGLKFLEAESFSNVLDDSGYEAFYGITSVEHVAMNGIVMYFDPREDRPISVRRRVEAKPGRYQIWMLARTLHERFRTTRGVMGVEVDGRRVATMDSTSRRHRDFWDSNVVFEWVPAGEVTSPGAFTLTLTAERPRGALGGLVEIDALALVPVGVPDLGGTGGRN